MKFDLMNAHGATFTAIIRNKACTGIIQVEDAGVYLCQDIISGAQADNRHGYKKSYYVERGSAECLDKYLVRNLIFNL